MTAVAAGTTAVLTLGIGAMAVGFGAWFARFHVSNPEEIVTSAGGFAFMAASTGYLCAVLWLESQPIRRWVAASLFRREIETGWADAVAFAAAGLLTAAVILGSIRWGAASLERRDLA
jgi:hypothetical protein